MDNALSSTVTRRAFLGAVGVAGAALGFGLAPQVQGAADQKIPVGLQLYSIRVQCQTDLPGMLAAASKIGYRSVEFAGYYGRSARELRTMLDDNGFVAAAPTPLTSPSWATSSRRPLNSTAPLATCF
jgi:hypothetical protein